MWPLASGVLVERLADGDNYDGLPTVFSLLHPLDELCPVTCRTPTKGKHCGGACVRGRAGGTHVRGHAGGTHVRGAGGTHVRGRAGGTHVRGHTCEGSCFVSAEPGVTTLGFFGDLGLQVLDVCDEATPPLVLTYNTSSQLHSIWSIQQATKEVRGA